MTVAPGESASGQFSTGGRTHAGFVDAGLAQRIALFVAPLLIGAHGTTPLIDGAGARSPAHGVRITERRLVPLGADLLVLGRVG